MSTRWWKKSRRKQQRNNKTEQITNRSSTLRCAGRAVARCSTQRYLTENMKISSIDHLVLTVKDLEKTIEFYTSLLGMKVERFGEGRVALKFGNQKINLHEQGK